MVQSYTEVKIYKYEHMSLFDFIIFIGISFSGHLFFLIFLISFFFLLFLSVVNYTLILYMF